MAAEVTRIVTVPSASQTPQNSDSAPRLRGPRASHSPQHIPLQGHDAQCAGHSPESDTLRGTRLHTPPQPVLALFRENAPRSLPPLQILSAPPYPRAEAAREDTRPEKVQRVGRSTHFLLSSRTFDSDGGAAKITRYLYECSEQDTGGPRARESQRLQWSEA